MQPVVRKGRAIINKKVFDLVVLDLGYPYNYTMYLGNLIGFFPNGNVDLFLPFNGIAVQAYPLVGLPRDNKLFEEANLVKKDIPGLYPWCQKQLAIIETADGLSRYEIDKEEADIKYLQKITDNAYKSMNIKPLYIDNGSYTVNNSNAEKKKNGKFVFEINTITFHPNKIVV